MPFPFKRSCLSLASVVTFSFDRTVAATLYGVSGAESRAELLTYVAGDGALSGDSLVLFRNSSTRVASSWIGADPVSAAAYVASMVERDDRNATAYLLAVGMGSSESISGVRNAALRMAMERWLAISGDGESEIIQNDRGRGPGSGGESTDREIALNRINSDPSLGTDPAYGLSSSAAVIPEPSAALLGGLSLFGLLRRRRIS